MRDTPRDMPSFCRPLGVLALAASLLGLGGPADAATRAEVLARAVRVADRLASLRSFDRGWEDGPYLVGSLQVWEELQKETPGAAPQLRERVRRVVDNGTSPVTNGDNCGYAQAALDLFRLATPGDPDRGPLLGAAAGPLAFAHFAMRRDPAREPPLSPWWVDGGYGTRFWQDDFYTLVPWLAMLGSTREALPGDADARDLAYEWIEAYANDHRSDASPWVASRFEARGPFLRDRDSGLFWHDPTVLGARAFWARGNGWVAWSLARAQRYLDRPYAGGRFAHVPDRAELRRWLARMAATLATERNESGTWNADIVRRDVFTKPETSGTALLTYMLATGVAEGWLDRETYLPIVLAAYRALLAEVDEDGDVHDIQPPGTGPDSALVASDAGTANVDYGVGAFLLASVAVARLGDGALASLESAPVPPAPFARRTFFAPAGTRRLTITNPSAREVTFEFRPHVGDPLRSTLAPSASTVIETYRPGPYRVDADADVEVAAAGETRETRDAEPFEALERRPRRLAIRRLTATFALPVVELADALLEGEETVLAETARVTFLNLSSIDADLSLEARRGEGAPVAGIRLAVPAGGQVTWTGGRDVSAVLVRNLTAGSAVAPFADRYSTK